MNYKEELKLVMEDYLWHCINETRGSYIEDEAKRMSEKYNMNVDDVIEDMDRYFIMNFDDLYELA